MAQQLLTWPGDYKAFKALIAAQINGVTLKTDPNFVVGTSNKTPEFLKLSPQGVTPVLVCDEGVVLESNAIARHVARHRNDTGLLGRTFFEQAQVDSWMEFCSNQVEVSAMAWVFPVLGFADFNHQNTKRAKTDLKASLKVLNNHLASRTYMVGERLSLADVALASSLVYPFTLVMDGNYRRNFPNVLRWFLTCTGKAAFKEVLGDLVLCVKELQPKKSKKEKKPKKAKKAKVAQAPKPKKAKKAKHPLLCLPKSTMVMDEWKRTYSNFKGEDFYGVMEKFYAMYDPEGYSIHHMKYKFSSKDETAVDWKVGNKVACYIQRLTDMQKYSFGTICVLDTSEASGFFEVEGVFLVRGQEAEKFMVEATEESAGYSWTKMDHTNAVDKKRISDFWCGEDDTQRKVHFSTGEVFK